MELILWIVAVVLVLVGIVQIAQGQIVLGIVLIVAGLLVGPGGVSIFSAQPAGALGLEHPGDSSPDAAIGRQLTVNNTLVTLLVGAILPIVNALLLRETNPRWAKTLVASLVAAGATAISQTVQDDGAALLSQEWAIQLGLTWATMILAYYGLWKPTVNPDANVPTVAPVGDVVALADPQVRRDRDQRAAA